MYTERMQRHSVHSTLLVRVRVHVDDLYVPLGCLILDALLLLAPPPLVIRTTSLLLQMCLSRQRLHRERKCAPYKDRKHLRLAQTVRR
jgi:hypothetical protein